MRTSLVVFRHGGTHLTVRLVRKLSPFPVVEPLKQADTFKPNGPVIISWRDPRDLIVAKLRFDIKRKRKGPMEDKDRAVCKFLSHDRIRRNVGWHGITFMTAMLRHTRRWSGVEGFRLPFEVITDPAQGEALADDLARYLGGDGGAEQYRRIYATGSTFNHERSQWRDWFGKAAIKSFVHQGGKELLELQGYRW